MNEKKIRGFEKVSRKTYPDDIEVKLPLRSTRTACGYDFVTPIDIDIPPQQKVTFKTDIKAYMQENEGLFFFPRSSIGTKHDLMISNTVGVGDPDFYDNVDNEGNYQISLRNLRPEIAFKGYKLQSLSHGIWEHYIDIPDIEDLREENTVRIKAGDRVVQAIFIPTLPADNCNGDAERIGGVGSTGR
jgi:dUTP pyrophosphatase